MTVGSGMLVRAGGDQHLNELIPGTVIADPTDTRPPITPGQANDPASTTYTGRGSFAAFGSIVVTTHWIADMGALYVCTAFGFNAGSLTYHFREFDEIQHGPSISGPWTTVANMVQLPGQDRWGFDAATARYWRVGRTESRGPGGFFFLGIEFYDWTADYRAPKSRILMGSGVASGVPGG